MLLDLILLAIAILLGLLWKFNETRPKNFPPGPIGIPILGHLPFLGPKAHKTLLKWKKTYGPVIGVWFGSFRTVVLNDAKTIREAANLSAFSGRPKLTLFTGRSGGIAKGIMFTEGHEWTEQRRFTLRYLRDFGFGRQSLEAKIQAEIQELMENLKKLSGKPFDVTHVFYVPVINALWSILFGERMNLDDPEMLQAIPAMETLINGTDFLTSFSILLPWLNNVSTKLSGYDKIMRNNNVLKAFLQRQIDKHQENYVPDQPRDFVDAYTDQVKRTKDTESSFHESQGEMLYSLLDLFLAGTDTASTTMGWTLAYLLHHPQVQEKLQKEIDDVIGRTRLPSLADRSSMPYAEAVINEILRYSTLLYFAAFHRATEDVQFRGYFIPKDTVIITNLYAAHYDEDAWGDPHNFRPERFLDDGGKFLRNENLLPFSTGKRVCIGEGLARDEIFLFITHLFQIFTAFPTEKLPNLEPMVGLTLSPPPFEVILRER